MDDPVNAVDPRGEFVISGPIGLFLAGKALAGAIAGTGLFAASKAVGDPDVTIQAGDKKIDTKLSTAAATAGVAAPLATGAAGAAAMAAPEAIPAAGRAAAALAGKAGQAAAKAETNLINTGAQAATVASQIVHNPKVQQTANDLAEFAAGYGVPGPPPASLPGYMGAGANWIVDKLQKGSKSKHEK